MAYAWESLSDEELLGVRLCDLGVQIKGKELKPRVQRLSTSLADRMITLKPIIYLADEWL